MTENEPFLKSSSVEVNFDRGGEQLDNVLGHSTPCRD